MLIDGEQNELRQIISRVRSEFWFWLVTTHLEMEGKSFCFPWSPTSGLGSVVNLSLICPPQHQMIRSHSVFLMSCEWLWQLVFYFLVYCIKWGVTVSHWALFLPVSLTRSVIGWEDVFQMGVSFSVVVKATNSVPLYFTHSFAWRRECRYTLQHNWCLRLIGAV